MEAPRIKPIKSDHAQEAAKINTEINNNIELETAADNMVLNFSGHKEGFLLHQDLKNLIKMLEKNPTTYQLKLTITQED